ncbi:metal ABC transporter ATP-binding protein [Vreelandella rituensis]|nr:metal ABC transporter ATP-binding protein [Halomonas rituensis]
MISEPDSSAVDIQGVYAAYDGQPVLMDINLRLKAHQWTAIIGPNGAGKSTLFHLLIGSMKPLRGSIQVFGGSLSEHRRAGTIAYMAQREAIEWDFPISVKEAVMTARYGLMRQDTVWRRLLPPRWSARSHHQAVEEALEAVDMSALARRPIGALSGGQKKRVLLARALAQNAKVLLLDEPLAGVDPVSERLILKVLAQQRSAGRTILMVTHDLVGTRQHADHVVLINRGVVDQGIPEQMLSEHMLARMAVATPLDLAEEWQ